ncbi:hypothetical protein [uncultured Gammaproteobacteria bacterium]|nr:hypothetical protein [uncultured Gammaproteobacteria bacterium]
MVLPVTLAISAFNASSASNTNLSFVSFKPAPPNTTLMVLISVSVVSAMFASKATPVAICIVPVVTELLDWMPVIGSKSIIGDESLTATLCLTKGVVSCLG